MSDIWIEKIDQRKMRMWSQNRPCCPNCGKLMEEEDVVGAKYKEPFVFKRGNGGRTTSDLIVCRCPMCGKLYTVHFLARTSPCPGDTIEYR